MISDPPLQQEAKLQLASQKKTISGPEHVKYRKGPRTIMLQIYVGSRGICSIIVRGPLLILRPLYVFWDRRSLQIRYAVFFQHGFVHAFKCSDGFFFARHQHDTLSSLPPETRDVAARDSGDKRVQGTEPDIVNGSILQF